MNNIDWKKKYLKYKKKYLDLKAGGMTCDMLLRMAIEKIYNDTILVNEIASEYKFEPSTVGISVFIHFRYSGDNLEDDARGFQTRIIRLAIIIAENFKNKLWENTLDDSCRELQSKGKIFDLARDIFNDFLDEKLEELNLKRKK